MRRHSPRVFRVTGRFFRRPAQAEEAAQEVFLRAYTQMGSYQGHGSLEGWITRIATNVCLNLLRDAKRRPESLAADLSERESAWVERRLANSSAERHREAEDRFVAADLADKVLSTMAPDDRIALVLVDGESLSIKETAEMTGWSEAKVKTQAFRARRRMREAVEKLLGKIPGKTS